MDFDLHRVAAILVPYGAYGKSLGHLVLDLNDLPRARREVCRKSKEQILGDALLHRQPPSAVALSPPDLWIDRQRGNARKFFHSTAELAGQLPGDDRFGRGAARGSGLRRLTRGEKIDDIDGREWRIRSVCGAQSIDRPGEIHAEIELVYSGRYENVDHRLSADRIHKLNNTALHFIAISIKEELSAGDIRPAQKYRFSSGSSHHQIG